MSIARVAKITVAALAFASVAVGFIYYNPDLSKEELSASYMNESSEKMTLSSGAEMHYRDEGRHDGPVLVMIHGGFGSLHNWEGWVSPLSSKFRLISMDLLGHGLTGSYPANIYDRHTERDAVFELLGKLGVSSYFLAGNSFGGGIALEMALAHPEQVRGLILVDSEGIPNGAEGYDVASFNDDDKSSPEDADFTKTSWTERIGSRLIGSAAVRRALESMVHDQALLTDSFVQQFTDLLRHEGNREAQLLMFRQGMHLISQNGPQDLLPRLSEITMPALIIHGEQDTLVPMRVAETFDRKIPNSQLSVIQDAGHMPMIEKPLETARVVEAFIDANSGL